jgi:hypothetical protein
MMAHGVVKILGHIGQCTSNDNQILFREYDYLV